LKIVEPRYHLPILVVGEIFTNLHDAMNRAIESRLDFGAKSENLQITTIFRLVKLATVQTLLSRHQCSLTYIASDRMEEEQFLSDCHVNKYNLPQHGAFPRSIPYSSI
jgi:hypothetical protein